MTRHALLFSLAAATCAITLSQSASAQSPTVTYPADPTETVATGERPEELPYGEYDAIPPGYRVESYHSKGMIAAGASTLAGSYAVTIGLGVFFREFCIFGPCEPDTRFDAMFVPIVGPSITAVQVQEDMPAAAGMAWGLTVAQSAGLALFIAGLTTERQKLVLTESNDGDWQGHVELVPSLGGARVDMTF